MADRQFPDRATATPEQLRGAIDNGRTGDKVAASDPAAVPLGADDEAAGRPVSPERAATALRQETGRPQRAGAEPGQDNRGQGWSVPVFILIALACALALVLTLWWR